MGAAEPLRAVSKMEPALGPLCAIELAERRKHALVHNYWRTLKGDRPFPSIWDLDPFEIADAGPNSVMLDLSKDRENPEIFVGDALRYDSSSDNDNGKRADAQALLSCVLNNYRSVLGKSGPVVFEDSCAADGHRTLSCFGTLFPFSSTGSSIDYVFGLLSWKDVVQDAASGDAVSAEAPSEVPAPVAVQAMTDETVLDEAVADCVAPIDAAPEEAVPEAAVPEVTVPEEAVSDAAVPEAVLSNDAVTGQAMTDDTVLDEAVSDDVAPIGAAPEDAVPEDVVPDLAFSEIALSDEAVSDHVAPVDAAAEDAVSEDPVPEGAVSDVAIPEIVLSNEAMFGDAMSEDPVSDVALSDDLPAGSDNSRSDGAAADDIRSHFTAFGKAVFAAVKHIAVADHVVSYGSLRKDGLSGHDMSAPDAVPDQIVPEAAVPDAAMPVDAVPGAALSHEPGFAVPDNVAPEDVMPGAEPSDDAASNEAVSDHAVIVPMAPCDSMLDDTKCDDAVSEEPIFDEPMAREGLSKVAVPNLAVIVPMVRYDASLDEVESDDPAPVAAPVPTPEPEVAETDPDAAPTATSGVSFSQQYEGVEVSDDLRRCFEEVAQPPEPIRESADADLRTQLSIAQAIAAAAPDANYHSRASLYVALGHAYDFALAAEAQPEAYRQILEGAGLEPQIQAPMTPLVELVFGSGYDGKRLNDFAALLSRSRHVNLPAGSLASHLEFLEAGLAIVAPV